MGVSKTLIIIGAVLIICAIIGLFLVGMEEVEPGHWVATGTEALVMIGIGALGGILIFAGLVYHWVK